MSRDYAPMSSTCTQTNGTVTARWLSFKDAERYSSFSTRYLELREHAGDITVARVSPNGTKGKRLIDRVSLDRFIESFVGAPPSKLRMNERRANA